MKRLLQILSCFILLAGCASTKEVVLEYDRVVGIQEIDYDHLKEKLDSPVDFIIYIGRPDCGDCQMFQPYLEDYLESHDQSGIYYLNIKTFRDAAYQEDASKEQKEFYDHLKENLGFVWTPTIIHYANGKKIDAYEFLDASFGRYDENNQEQQNKLKQFVKDFEQWMDQNLKIEVKSDE